MVENPLRIKLVCTNASDAVAYIHLTTIFRVKFRVGKVVVDIIDVAVNSTRNLSFGEEKKVKFRAREMMLNRMEIRMKPASVTEIYKKKNSYISYQDTLYGHQIE